MASSKMNPRTRFAAALGGIVAVALAINIIANIAKKGSGGSRMPASVGTSAVGPGYIPASEVNPPKP